MNSRKWTFTIFTILLCSSLTIHTSAKAQEVDRSSTQVPLLKLIRIDKSYAEDNLASSIDTEHKKWLALGMTQISLRHDETERSMTIVGILNQFIGAAFSDRGVYSPYQNEGKPRHDILYEVKADDANAYLTVPQYRDDASEKFESDFPWLQSLLSINDQAPRVPAINKWKSEIRVSTGLPNDLQPINWTSSDSEVSILKAPYERRYPDKERIVEDQVSGMTRELSSLTGLNIEFVPHDKEKPEAYSNLRVVLTDEYDVEKSVYRLVHDPQKYTDKYGHSILNGADPFREGVEPHFNNAVRFAPTLDANIDGYFVPDAKNEIRFAVCYVWSGHAEEVIRALVSECLIRSLGLPDVIATSRADVLTNWNESAPTEFPDLNSIPKNTSALDAVLLRILYDPEVKAGTSARATYSLIRRKFINEIEKQLQGEDQ